MACAPSSLPAVVGRPMRTPTARMVATTSSQAVRTFGVAAS